jgi:hypothetical protein
MAAQFSVACECSKVIRIPATAAGTAVRCECGRETSVPSLRQLREQAAVSGSDSVLHVQRLIETGALPAKSECVVCGVKTDRIRQFRVKHRSAEDRAALNRHRNLWWLWVLGLFAFWFCGGWLVAAWFGTRIWNQRKDLVAASDIDLALPVALCDSCGSEVRGGGRIKQVLAEVPPYARLLQDYPRITVSEAG